MTYRDHQVLFARLIPRLVDHAFHLGFECTMGELYRSDEQAAINALREDGRARLANYLEERAEFHPLAAAITNNGKGNGILLSIHRDRLALDLNLFKDGRYLSDGEAHRPLGEWWEKQHELCRWGGRFRDANHYSLTWQGRA